ncbi:MAG: ComEC/Rec2 family competence protein [Minisyncoccia bacterium]
MFKSYLRGLNEKDLPSKFLLLILIFIVGVFFSSFFETAGLIASISIFLFALIFCFQEYLFKNKIIFGIYLLVFAIGFSYFQIYEQYQKTHSSLWLNGKTMQNITAVISSLPVYQNNFVSFEAKLSPPLKGKILIKTKNNNENFQYGDKIIFSGKFEEPASFSNFDYKSYLAKSNIYSVVNYPQIKVIGSHQGFWLNNFLYGIKNCFQKQINNVFPEPEKSFLNGLLLGEKKTLDKNLEVALQKTGTIHLIALSGFNITIITNAVYSFLIFLGIARPKAFWLVIIFILLFVILTGASPSIVRAGIMGGILVLSYKIGKPYQIKNALFFAAFLMLLLNPKILRFDMGFQLSFAATLGLIYLSPFFNRLFQVEKPSFLNWREVIATTFSAQSAVLPLLIFRFGYISLISPIANVLIISLIPYTMLLGFIAIILSYLNLWLGIVFGFFPYLLLHFEVLLIKMFGSLPFATLNFGRFSEIIFWLVVAFYIFVYLLKNVRTKAQVFQN